MEQLRFDGRVALVTGAGNGVGRAHALLLARRGARVVVNDIGGDVDGRGTSRLVAQDVVDAIQAEGGEAVADTNSVADESGAQRMVATALEAWGRLDIVVNNAGVLDTIDFVTGDDERDRRVVGTHLHGTINVTRAAWPLMAERRYGRVVCTSSGAIFGSPVGFAYQAAKGGVLAFGRGLATAGRSVGVNVNVILPTAFTRMTDSIPDPDFRAFMKRRFTPERIAAFVAVLAHETCELNGEAFLVGGGRVARLVLGATEGVVLDDATPEDLVSNLPRIVAAEVVSHPPDRLAEFQSYLGGLGYGQSELRMEGLVRGGEAQ